jgi:23S rRNA pseudouridine2605 synthase
MVRLQKFIAEAGVASRRKAEQMILDGLVEVNGQCVREMGTQVDPTHDRVLVEGRAIRPKPKLYIALNKPRGVLCTRNDPESRRTVSDLLPQEWGHLTHVGRLDMESEGLIFLTNDGDFALRLTHPRYGVLKTYVATVTGHVSQELMPKLTAGVLDEGERIRADKARLLSSNNTRSVVELQLSEGKNREVRRLFGVLGFTVERLARIRIGPIWLGELPVGKWRTLTAPEIETLLRPQ